MDEVLIEWALSDDESLRFDALYVIEEHSIARAVPALLSLHSRLEDESKRPGAPFEAAKVARILERLRTR